MLTIMLSLYLTGSVLLGIVVFLLTAGFPGRMSWWERVQTTAWVLLWPVTLPFALVRDGIRGDR